MSTNKDNLTTKKLHKLSQCIYNNSLVYKVIFIIQVQKVGNKKLKY